MDGKLWQLLRLRREEPSGEMLVQWNPPSGPQSGVVRDWASASEVPATSTDPEEQVQNESERLVLATSFGIGRISGNLTKDTIPWRQSGQAIEPVGP